MTRRLRGEVFGAEYLGTTQIVTVDDRARHAQGAAPGRHRGSAAASRSGSASGAEKLSLFDKAIGPGGAHGAAWMEARHG